MAVFVVPDPLTLNCILPPSDTEGDAGDRAKVGGWLEEMVDTPAQPTMTTTSAHMAPTKNKRAETFNICTTPKRTRLACGGIRILHRNHRGQAPDSERQTVDMPPSRHHLSV